MIFDNNEDETDENHEQNKSWGLRQNVDDFARVAARWKWGRIKYEEQPMELVKSSCRVKTRAYFIFVTFFTQPQFEARTFYTLKRVNARQKLSYDKTA